MGERSYFNRNSFQANKPERMKTETMLAYPLTTADSMGPIKQCNNKAQTNRVATNNIERRDIIDKTIASCFIPTERNQLTRQHSSISDRSRTSTRSSQSDNDNCYVDVEATIDASVTDSATAITNMEQPTCIGDSPSLELAAAEDMDKCDSGTHCDDSAARAQSSQSHASPDHTETIEIHPEPSTTTASTSGRKKSKLRAASRAILLFKRRPTSTSAARGTATNTSSREATSSSGRRLERSSALSYPRSLVATFWRQNTADNSTCTQSSRRDSLRSQRSNCEPAANSRGTAPTKSTSTFSLPRFIVPKMNALKLPIVCQIKSVDGKLMREVFVHRYELGQYLIDSLNVSLGMVDAKYFGLKLARSLDEQEDVAQPWLDLNESVYKQISKHSKLVTLTSSGGGDSACPESESTRNIQRQSQQAPATAKSVDLYLRIKFYPPNLARIQEQFLREYLWLQLRRDLRLGKLVSSKNNLSYLMACALQYELGDYAPDLITGKLSELNILPNQDLIEQQAIEIWQSRLVGTRKHQSQMQFLRASVILETYGFDYYPVRDHQRQQAYLLGFNYAGVKTIRNNRIMHHFRWNSMSKISYERRMIIFHIYPSENSKRKQILGFKCLSNEECQNLYMRLLEQKYFFTVDLTYFDKSLRNPLPLAESATGQQERSNCEAWPQQFSSSQQESEGVDYESGDNTTGDQADGCRQSSDALQNSQSSSSHVSGSDRLGSAESGGRHGDEPRQTGTRQRAGVKQPIVCNTCDCIDCKREAKFGHRLQHEKHSNNQSLDSTSSSGHHQTASTGHLLKSISLQESSLTKNSSLTTIQAPDCRALAAGAKLPALVRSYCCDGSRICPLSSGGGRQVHDELLVNECDSVGGDRLITEPSARCRFAQPALERQRSMLKYSPEFENESRDMDWRDNDMKESDNEIRQDATGSRFRPNRSASPDDKTESEQYQGPNYRATGNCDLAPAKQTFGQRFVSLTEQMLTQPTRLFGSATLPAHRQDCNDEQQRITSVHSAAPREVQTNLFVQALIFGVFLLIVNLVFRLSEAISSAVIYLLTFKSTDQDSTGQQPVICSPLLSSYSGGGQ